MPIALGAMPEPTTGAKSRLLHAGAMPTLDAFLFSSPAFWFFPPFSSHAFEFFLVLPYKNKVFSFFSFFSSFWAIPPARRAATWAGWRAGGLAQNEEKKGKKEKTLFL